MRILPVFAAIATSIAALPARAENWVLVDSNSSTRMYANSDLIVRNDGAVAVPVKLIKDGSTYSTNFGAHCATNIYLFKSSDYSSDPKVASPESMAYSLIRYLCR